MTSLYGTLIAAGLLDGPPPTPEEIARLAPKRTTQVRLDRATAEKLRDIAHDLGYVQTSGPLVGEGSTVKMWEAVASGELLVVRSAVRSDTPEAAEKGPKARRSAKK